MWIVPLGNCPEVKVLLLTGHILMRHNCVYFLMPKHVKHFLKEASCVPTREHAKKLQGLA